MPPRKNPPTDTEAPQALKARPKAHMKTATTAVSTQALHGEDVLPVLVQKVRVREKNDHKNATFCCG